MSFLACIAQAVLSGIVTAVMVVAVPVGSCYAAFAASRFLTKKAPELTIYALAGASIAACAFFIGLNSLDSRCQAAFEPYASALFWAGPALFLSALWGIEAGDCDLDKLRRQNEGR